jgi:pimeloyl-ACP methyl ester carboxylesterase
MPFATTPDGTRLYYDTLGQGPALVLISGQAFDHHMWDEVRDDFAAHFQVIVFDHRGCGQSDKPEQAGAYSTRVFAGDVIAILDELGIQRAHAYGFSMGGRIAQWLGIDHADRMLSLVLGATTPGNAHGVKRSAQADEALASGKPSALRDMMVSPSWQSQHPEWVAMMAHRARHPMPPHAQRLHYMASEMHDAWAQLPQVNTPTLVIHGTADQINVCANAALLCARIPGARLHLVEGALHGYFWEYRDTASAAVINFIKAH